MPSGKPSKKTLKMKIKKWVPKKGWVIKKVKNPVVYMAMPSYPAQSCPKCLFSPCWADAYGSYHCPRCSYQWQGSTPTVTARAASGPTRNCPVCGYGPCSRSIITGSYHCPHCGADF